MKTVLKSTLEDFGMMLDAVLPIEITFVLMKSSHGLLLLLNTVSTLFAYLTLTHVDFTEKFPCDNGFTLMNDGCYAFFGNNEVTYAEAKSTCESVGAKLFEPQSMASHKLIDDWVYGMFRGDTKLWLGITRQSSGE